MIHVLFVCLGNICRSPMAEAVFRHLVEQEGLSDQISIDSAGTGSWHVGKRPHKGTLAKLAEYKISSEGMKARQLQKEDAIAFDYIVAMDESNLANMKPVIGEPEGVTVIRLLDLTEHKKDVPDSYYTNDFQETYNLVLDGCQALLKEIKKTI
ncbi:low molecular weight protein-tyrosine-phosphatase [Halalkalibacter hemicellulosilyticus]|uniref:protein-tyrosine-phosphatase n=1 Tax=Halalkalibacter hemicellulosilyticusJCM 9152 TaxID=1236971 RepID=W4QBU2_9BACI|nr:low molecular weight protein-tyrosine-phosphatase [Halalkalibacter hemicellulosilyticus]GAE28864.1 low molecular weight protein tyrosine phosphatase [Halalkalibacter hemicellulosilyticusJCM 9152]